LQSVDCNDNDDDIFPGATEISCDGVENNCLAPNYPFPPANETDADGDGFAPCEGDCNDADANIHPGAVDICNGIDDNCNGIVDEFFVDNDHDGAPLQTCATATPGQTSALAADCDDNDPINSPAFQEKNFIGDDGFGDFKDNDCDGAIDNGLPRIAGSIDVSVADRKRSRPSHSSHSAQPPVAAATITITISNTGLAGASGIVVKGTIALPRHASLVTPSSANGFYLQANGDFVYTIDSLASAASTSQAITVNLQSEHDARDVRVVAAVTATDSGSIVFTPHVIFTSF